MVRPREMRGAQRTDLVWNWVEASNRRAKRGSFEVSLTMVGSPVCATQPAIPSPTLTRNTATSLPFSPRASSKVSSCFSSSSMRMDQASEGISSWTLAMISSMILRGSRMEFAVFTMSVRIERRRVVVRRRPWVSPARRTWPSRARASSKWASTSRACGSPPVRQEARNRTPARVTASARRRRRAGSATGRWGKVRRRAGAAPSLGPDLHRRLRGGLVQRTVPTTPGRTRSPDRVAGGRFFGGRVR
jgi:hypothetical protein